MTGSSPTPIIGVIPARLASTRLPRKVLREIAGQPLVAWVYQAAAAAKVFDRLLLAVDSEEVAQLCRARGWDFLLTSPELPSGTDRMHAVAQALRQENTLSDPGAIFVNIQGDEPLLRPEHFQALLRAFANAETMVSTLRTPCRPEEIINPNIVKVVVDSNSRALYFSRAPIPWDRDGHGGLQHWKHLGLYAYRSQVLDRFSKLPPSSLEKAERLEQLRLLENGISIQVESIEFDTIGVDTEADLEAVTTLLLQSRS